MSEDSEVTEKPREDALADMRARNEIEYAHELMFLRTFMRGVYESRKQYSEAFVTADDVADQYDHAVAMGDLPAHESRSFLSQVFVTPGWEKTGVKIYSIRESNRKRLINCWKFVGEG